MNQPKNPFHPGEILLEEARLDASAIERNHQRQTRHHRRSRTGSVRNIGNLRQALDEPASHV
jgi:hypothetical protein